MPEKIELKFICLLENKNEDLPGCILLGVLNSDVKIPILIGEHETETLALSIKGIKRRRPSAQDLFVELLCCSGMTLKEVFIYHYDAGVYKAELVMENRNGIYRIDSRPSDAIYIQQKLNVPIYTTREVLDEAGIITDKEKKKAVSNLKPKNRLSSIDIYDLQKMLNIAIKNEDYEQAAQIHAEIKHRSEQK